jgi:hypothetical protein
MPVTGPNGDRWRYLPVAPEGFVAKGCLAGKTYLIATPSPEMAQIIVTLHLDRYGSPRPTFIMPRVAATMLYKYMSEGESEAAARLAGSAELCALELVENKVEDPVSGALGMYLLLNTGRLDYIGERSEKLYHYNARLADGAIIWAEHLARIGRHEEAATVLKSLKERGIPALTVGFSTALSRISTYIRAGLESERLTEIESMLRYWARRAIPNSPTTVIELDDEWAKRVHLKLGWIG